MAEPFYHDHTQPHIPFPRDPRDAPYHATPPPEPRLRQASQASPRPVSPLSHADAPYDLYTEPAPPPSPFPSTTPWPAPQNQQPSLHEHLRPSLHDNNRRPSTSPAYNPYSPAPSPRPAPLQETNHRTSTPFLLDPRPSTAPNPIPFPDPSDHTRAPLTPTAGALMPYTGPSAPSGSSTTAYPGQFPTDHYPEHPSNLQLTPHRRPSDANPAHDHSYFPAYDHAYAYTHDARPDRPRTYSSASRRSSGGGGGRRSHGGSRRRSSSAERERRRRIDEIERRPTLSDSVVLVWDTLRGAVTGRRE